MKIAIIDSGIWSDHPRLTNCKISGIGIRLKDDGKNFEYVKDYSDDSGHGTAMCGIIHKKCPQAEIVAVKINWDKEITSEAVLVEAIKWCVQDKNISLINISMGIPTNTPSEDLRDVCQLAYERNLAIVASYSNTSYTATYPAFFPTVFGVTGCRCKKSMDYGYIDSNPIEFIAKGNSQRVASIREPFAIQEGASYATAHFAGIVASVIQNHQYKNIDNLRRYLQMHANKNLGWEDTITTPGANYAYLVANHSEKSGEDMFSPENRLNNNSRLGIYPGDDKEMSGFKYFQSICQFSIGKIVNYPKSVLQSPDEKSGLLSRDDYNLFDTLVLGYYIESLFEANILYGDEIVRECLQRNYNIITWSKEIKKRITRFPSYSEECNLIVPCVTQKDLEQLSPFIHSGKIKCPTLLVVGTGSKQGKFTTQLRLKEVLTQEGYSVGHISTEPQGLLFGANYVFPYGKNSTVEIPVQKWGYLLRCIQRGLYHTCKPDIIISGTQSDIMPRQLTSSELMLPSLFDSLAYVAGMEPDGIICAINPEDTIEIIERTLHSVQLVSKAKTLMFVMRPWTRIEEKRENTIIRTKSKTLQEDEYKETMQKFSKYFGLPVIDVKDKKNDTLILKIIEDAF